MNLIDHGISRIKHAADCYAVLLKELKILANTDQCKLLVIADYVNNYFTSKPLIRFPDGKIPSVEDITIARAFMKLFNNNWVFFLN